jgi:hypothetical protein
MHQHIEVSLANENVAFTYFQLTFDKTQHKTGSIITLIDSGGITRTVMFSFIAE